MKRLNTPSVLLKLTDESLLVYLMPMMNATRIEIVLGIPMLKEHQMRITSFVRNMHKSFQLLTENARTKTYATMLFALKNVCILEFIQYY